MCIFLRVQIYCSTFLWCHLRLHDFCNTLRYRSHVSVCSTTLFIGHLTKHTSEGELTKELAPFGPIGDVKVFSADTQDIELRID